MTNCKRSLKNDHSKLQSLTLLTTLRICRKNFHSCVCAQVEEKKLCLDPLSYYVSRASIKCDERRNSAKAQNSISRRGGDDSRNGNILFAKKRAKLDHFCAKLSSN